MGTRFATLNRFRIAVTVARGRISIDPDPATVDQGTMVEWHIGAAGGLPDLRCELYFEGSSAFSWSTQRTSVLSPYSSPAVISAVAEYPGDHKYGVRAFASATEELLADDDPHLVVRRLR